VVTERIRNLYDIAVKERDPKTQDLLTWYLDEQVEEEESALRVLDVLRKAAGPARWNRWIRSMRGGSRAAMSPSTWEALQSSPASLRTPTRSHDLTATDENS
jgi:hypothetical protein